MRFLITGPGMQMNEQSIDGHFGLVSPRVKR